jgi:hypothetical protein
MPLNKKGKKILAAMQKEYGKEKGKTVFYASENKGTIMGVKKKGKSMLKWLNNEKILAAMKEKEHTKKHERSESPSKKMREKALEKKKMSKGFKSLLSM